MIRAAFLPALLLSLSACLTLPAADAKPNTPPPAPPAAPTAPAPSAGNTPPVVGGNGAAPDTGDGMPGGPQAGVTPLNASAAAADIDTDVPPLTYSLETHTEVWTFGLDAKAREPFSFDRRMTQVTTKTPAVNTTPTISTDAMLKSLPDMYAQSLAAYKSALAAMSMYNTVTNDDTPLHLAAGKLTACMAELDLTRTKIGQIPYSKCTPEQRLPLDYWNSAASHLQRAASHMTSIVKLRLEFNDNVLQNADFDIVALQANTEDPSWPAGSVLFRGGAPSAVFKVNETIAPKELPAVQKMAIEIVGVTPTGVFVRFEHQALFKIPYPPQKKGDDDTKAGGKGKR
ncbi:MAG: hypothetical protein ACREJ2_14170 [Planctomycetota bacterium]